MADQNENMIFNIIRKSNAQKSQQAANKRQIIKEAENKADTRGQDYAKKQAAAMYAPDDTALQGKAYYGDELDQFETVNQVLNWINLESGNRLKPNDIYNKQIVEEVLDYIKNKPQNNTTKEKKEQIKKRVDNAKKIFFGNAVVRGNVDSTKDKIKPREMEEYGALGIHAAAANYADNNLFYGNKTDKGGLSRQKVVDALAQGVHNPSIYENEDATELKRLLRTAYVSYNKTGNSSYMSAAATIADKLGEKAYNNFQTPEDCIQYENMILSISQSADAEGGPYIDRARYDIIANHIRQLRNMKTNNISHYDENGTRLVDMPGNNSDAIKRTFAQEQNNINKKEQ
jgi:hypothetical protein